MIFAGLWGLSREVWTRRGPLSVTSVASTSSGGGRPARRSALRVRPARGHLCGGPLSVARPARRCAPGTTGAGSSLRRTAPGCRAGHRGQSCFPMAHVDCASRHILLPSRSEATDQRQLELPEILIVASQRQSRSARSESSLTLRAGLSLRPFAVASLPSTDDILGVVSSGRDGRRQLGAEVSAGR